MYSQIDREEEEEEKKEGRVCGLSGDVRNNRAGQR